MEFPSFASTPWPMGSKSISSVKSGAFKAAFPLILQSPVNACSFFHKILGEVQHFLLIDFPMHLLLNQFLMIDEKDSHLEEIIANFSRYIALKISEFNYTRYGIAQEDLFQEIYLKIWKALANSHNIKYMPAYIRKIVNSVVINQILISRKENKVIESQMQTTRDSYILPGSKKEEHLHNILFELINSLKESKKKVLYLFLMDYDIKEISILQGWSKGKAKYLFYRAIKDLKKMTCPYLLYHQ